MAPSFRKAPEELAHAKFAVIASWEGMDDGKCRIKAYPTLEVAKALRSD